MMVAEFGVDDVLVNTSLSEILPECPDIVQRLSFDEADTWQSVDHWKSRFGVDVFLVDYVNGNLALDIRGT